MQLALLFLSLVAGGVGLTFSFFRFQPSNMLVQYTGRPSIFLPTCIVIWGAISVATGFTHNFREALVTRSSFFRFSPLPRLP